MISRILGGTVVLLVVLLAFSGAAAAQTGPGCLAFMTIWSGDPVPPGYFYYSSYPGTYQYVIAIHTTQCPPQPKCPCSEGAPTNSGGHPIDFGTGDTYIYDTDVSLPGLGGGLTLRRQWNSVWPTSQITSSVGIFGPTWHSTYEERIVMGQGPDISNRWLAYSRGDGTYWSLGLSPVGTIAVAAPANVTATFSTTATYWALTFKNGEQRQFSPTTGLLTAIVDRNGNKTQLTYDGSNRLTTVTDQAGRHLYFNYPNNSSYIVTSVTSDFGVTLSYTYDTQGRLSQVTKPDSTIITYTYNNLSQITQVTDSNGKSLESHTYDSGGRGLTSSQANGVNALTVTYQ